MPYANISKSSADPRRAGTPWRWSIALLLAAACGPGTATDSATDGEPTTGETTGTAGTTGPEAPTEASTTEATSEGEPPPVVDCELVPTVRA